MTNIKVGNMKNTGKSGWWVGIKCGRSGRRNGANYKRVVDERTRCQLTTIINRLSKLSVGEF